MAGSAFSDMVVAVSEAGGLGSLACALLSVEQARRELETIRRHTSRPINLNFFCHQPPRDDSAREMTWRRRLDAYYAEPALENNGSIGSSNRAPFDDGLSRRTPLSATHFTRVRVWKELSSQTSGVLRELVNEYFDDVQPQPHPPQSALTKGLS